MISHTIQTTNLTKYYGASVGVSDINLSVKQGEIFGFLGPNGAGKTTTIRLLLDLIKPSRGSIHIFGKNIITHRKELLKNIGYLPGDIGLYKNLNGNEYLNHFMKLRKGRKSNWNNTTLNSLKERFKIDFPKKIKSCSKGMKQIICIIQTFMHNPQLVILDEPTSSLDPLMQESFYDLLQEFKENGGTVFLSSHILHEVKRICDRVGIIKKGKLISTEDIKKQTHLAGKKVTITLESSRQRTFNSIKNLSGVKDILIKKDNIEFFYIGNIQKLIQFMSSIKLKDFVCETPTVEDLFLRFYKD